MRKSLFSKIFLTQVVVALTVVIIIVPMIFLLIGEYFVSVQKDDILQDASRVATLTEQFIELGDNEAALEIFRNSIEFVGRESTVIVLNSSGGIVAAPKKVAGINIDRIDESFISDVKGGKSVIKLYEKGNIFNQQTIVAIAPVFKRDILSGERTFLGAAIALRFIPHVREIQYKIIGIVMVAQLIAWLLAFIVSFIITRQITKPIKKMRVAAKSISAGNFNERIPITANDEIGELAKSFNLMTQSLSELEQMRTSFLSNVSHELRTPMTIIGGFVEGILDGTISKEDMDKYLGIVLSEVRRLSRLVKDLLEATRLEQGKIKINKSNFDMNRLVTESLLSYEQQLEKKEIGVNFVFEGESCYAYADKDSIKRVMLNLIDNAIKFTPDGGKICVATKKDAGKVSTVIENTGEGISENDLRHIWERFYKSDKSRSMDKKGVGLGLYIVKTIINQHGGEIFAESKEGEFARFTFVIDEGSTDGVLYENRKDEQ